MRAIASIYLIIVLLNLGFWVGNESHYDFFLTPYVCLMWGLYLCSILALFAYAIGKRILPRKMWQLVFGIYLATRLFELASVGFAFNGGDLVADLNRVASYLWLVLPAGMAMCYLGFVKSGDKRGEKQLLTENNEYPQASIERERVDETQRIDIYGLAIPKPRTAPASNFSSHLNFRLIRKDNC